MRKIPASLLILGWAIPALAAAQDLTLDFDPDRTGYGVEETTGTDTLLALAINGSPTIADNFDEIDGLAVATVTATGSELGSFSPFSFTMVASDGGIIDVQGDGIDISGTGFDPGESLTFTFATDVLITELDFDSIGAGELAQVSIGGSIYTYGDSAGDSHAIAQALSAGAPLTFQYADTTAASYNLQGISLSIVPEPSSFALVAASLALILVALRRRLD